MRQRARVLRTIPDLNEEAAEPRPRQLPHSPSHAQRTSKLFSVRNAK